MLLSSFYGFHCIRDSIHRCFSFTAFLQCVGTNVFEFKTAFVGNNRLAAGASKQSYQSMCQAFMLKHITSSFHRRTVENHVEWWQWDRLTTVIITVVKDVLCLLHLGWRERETRESNMLPLVDGDALGLLYSVWSWTTTVYAGFHLNQSLPLNLCWYHLTYVRSVSLSESVERLVGRTVYARLFQGKQQETRKSYAVML